MRLMKVGLIISLVLLIVSQAHALSYRIGIVCFGNQPDCPQSIQAVNDAIDILEPQLDMDFQIVSMRQMNLPELPNVLMELRLASLMALGMHAMDRGEVDTYIFLSPKQVANEVGYTNVATYGRVIGTAIIHMFKDRQVNADIVAHEIGHTLGADHDISGLMTPALNSPFHSHKISYTSNQEIQEHLRYIQGDNP